MTRIICDLCCRHKDKREIRLFEPGKNQSQIVELTQKQIKQLIELGLDEYCKYFVITEPGLNYLNPEEIQLLKEKLYGSISSY